MKSKRIRRALRLAALAGLLGLSALVGLLASLERLGDPLLQARLEYQPSILVEDRHGRLMREFLSGRDTRSQWVGRAALSPHLIHAAVAAEDRRFYAHFGVDPLAVARAAWLNITAGRVVSGASTITMQLARALAPGPRTLPQKIRETALALRLEWFHTKDEILEEYLNRIPCGNLAYGAPAAARLYLDKSPSGLSPAEAAFIMALPQAPSLLNPYRNSDTALRRRNLILDRMAGLGYLDAEALDRAKREPLSLVRVEHRFHAPHFVNRVRAELPTPAPGRVRTTLDLELQTQVERLVEQAVNRSQGRNISQAAVVVLDHRTMEVLAWVGSADFFDAKDGQNDGVLALRQPGSTVKPLTYAAAFDHGLTPASMIDDEPVGFGLAAGVYSPVNYDRKFHGPVSARTALASSLNVPAVKVLHQVGLLRVFQAMKAAGLRSLNQEPDYYGLGLTLGCGEVSLLELAAAYATLASGGLYRQPVLLLPESGQAPAPGERVFSPQAAYLITDILNDDAARATGFGRDSLLALPFPAAAKTGTSKNFRDNWTVGYTSSVVVAVWAGNFDARPMGRVSGISGAGPLWRQVMEMAAHYCPPTPFARPDGLAEATVCPATGLRAAPPCPGRRTDLFIRGHEPDGYCLIHKQADESGEPPRRPTGLLAITSPRSGEQYLYDPGIEDGFQKLGLAARTPAGLDWLVWYVDGGEVGRVPATGSEAPGLYWPLRRGVHTIRLVGLAPGRTLPADPVCITVH